MAEETSSCIRCCYCDSTNIEYKRKKSVWECKSCEERFPGPPPESSSVHHLLVSDKAEQPKEIFFSYGHDDHQKLVMEFKRDLEKRGHTIWFDAKDIGTWEDWKGKITRGIDASQMAIAFLSKHALREPGVCRNEIAIALNRFGVIYPVTMEQEKELKEVIPVTIQNLQWLVLNDWQNIRKGNDWDRWYEEKLIEMIEKIEGEASHFSGESAALRTVLRPTKFESKFAQHLDGFVGREWVFTAYRRWLDKDPQSRLFWLKAGPGVGKTAFAVNLASRERGAIVASWFCDAKSNELRNPNQAILTLAYQLAIRWEDYRVRLLRELGVTANTVDDSLSQIRNELQKKNTQDLFRALISEPLANLIWREHKLVIVIDALDEATDEEGNNHLTDLIGSELASLPNWVSFVVTSRPEASVTARLQGFKPFEIDAQNEQNLADLRIWYLQHIDNHTELAKFSQDERRHVEGLLIDRSEGMMLYLQTVENALNEKSLQAADLDQLKKGVPGLYANYANSFQHRFGKDYEATIQPLTRLLVAANGPLPEDLACKVLGWNGEQLARAQRQLGSFIVTSGEGLSLFHKTLSEWLAHKTDNQFYVDPVLGRQQIADTLFEEAAKKELHAIQWREQIRYWLTNWLRDLPQNSQAQQLHDLGKCLNVWGDYSQAEPLLREAIRIEEKTKPHDDLSIAESYISLSSLLFNTARYDEAESLERGALEIRKSKLSADDPAIGSSLSGLAFLCSVTGRNDEAESLFLEALEVAVKAFPQDRLDIALAYSALAEFLTRNFRAYEAESLFRNALKILREELPEEHPLLASTLSNFAETLVTIADDFEKDTCKVMVHYKEAETLLRDALKIEKETLPTGHPLIASTLSDLASLLEKSDRIDEAHQLYRDALEIRRMTRPLGDPIVANHIKNLANSLQATGHYDEAEVLYREVVETKKAELPIDHIVVAESHQNLATLLKKSDRNSEAESHFREAKAIRTRAFQQHESQEIKTSQP